MSAHEVLRQRLHATVEHERVETARALGEREDEFMRLEVDGLLGCAVGTVRLNA